MQREDSREDVEGSEHTSTSPLPLHSPMRLLPLLLRLLPCLLAAGAFSPSRVGGGARPRPFPAPLYSAAPSDTSSDGTLDIPPSVRSASERVEDCKAGLIEACAGTDLGTASSDVEDRIRDLERLGEDAGFGQASALSGLMSGEWELVYSSDDVTRSSPFFWAFRRAFPDASDQIFDITDFIPAPIKEVGPATQTIEVDSASRPVTGTLVSRVRVATLGGAATSMMTTRCTVLAADGLDGLRLRVDTTKPEDSTVLKKLGPLGEAISSNSPPFPSGDALERAVPGSSEVGLRTTYCDEGLRVTRNDDRMSDVFVWKRTKFGDGATATGPRAGVLGR